MFAPFGLSLRLGDLSALLETLVSLDDEAEEVLTRIWAVAKVTETKADDRSVAWVISKAEELGLRVREPAKPASLWEALTDLFSELQDQGAMTGLSLTVEDPS